MAYPEEQEQDGPTTNPNNEPSPGTTYTTNQPLGVDNPNPQLPKPKNNKPMLILLGLITVGLLAAGLVLLKPDSTKDTNKDKTPVTNQEQPKEAIQPAGTVTISANGFTPATIKVRQGQTVTWTNTDDKPHQPATDPYPSTDPSSGFKSEEALGKNETYSFTFDKPGTYTYHDNLNPLKLKGTVVVE